jgi:hypothetical protein
VAAGMGRGVAPAACRAAGQAADLGFAYPPNTQADHSSRREGIRFGRPATVSAILCRRVLLAPRRAAHSAINLRLNGWTAAPASLRRSTGCCPIMEFGGSDLAASWSFHRLSRATAAARRAGGEVALQRLRRVERLEALTYDEALATQVIIDEPAGFAARLRRSNRKSASPGSWPNSIAAVKSRAHAC